MGVDTVLLHVEISTYQHRNKMDREKNEKVYTPRETDEINCLCGVLEPYHWRLNEVYRILCKQHTNTTHTWYNHEEVQDVNQQQE